MRKRHNPGTVVWISVGLGAVAAGAWAWLLLRRPRGPLVPEGPRGQSLEDFPLLEAMPSGCVAVPKREFEIEDLFTPFIIGPTTTQYQDRRTMPAGTVLRIRGPLMPLEARSAGTYHIPGSYEPSLPTILTVPKDAHGRVPYIVDLQGEDGRGEGHRVYLGPEDFDPPCRAWAERLATMTHYRLPAPVGSAGHQH